MNTKQNLTGHRQKIAAFVEGKRCVQFITALILLNAVTLGLDTNAAITQSYGSIITAIDTIILSVFVIELTLKFYAYRFSFFRSGWNLFDFLIVGIALIPSTGPFSILRALRILRILRLLSIVPQMRRVVTAFTASIPGMASVMGVLALIFYVSAVLATKLFGGHSDPNLQEWFGTLSASTYTLFQVMTLENWSDGIVRPTMEHYPWAWGFFIPFIIITSFAVLNLFIGIIVDAMQITQGKEDKEEIILKDLKKLHKRFDDLEEDIKQLKE